MVIDARHLTKVFETGRRRSRRRIAAVNDVCLVRLNVERHTTIFLTSHDVADIEHVAQRALVINHGSVIYDNEVAANAPDAAVHKLVELGFSRPPLLPSLDNVTVLEQGSLAVKLSVDTGGLGRANSWSVNSTRAGPPQAKGGAGDSCARSGAAAPVVSSALPRQRDETRGPLLGRPRSGRRPWK